MRKKYELVMTLEGNDMGAMVKSVAQILASAEACLKTDDKAQEILVRDGFIDFGGEVEEDSLEGNLRLRVNHHHEGMAPH